MTSGTPGTRISWGRVRCSRAISSPVSSPGFFPQRQAENDDGRQHHLQHRNNAVAALPTAVGQRPAHNDRPAAGAQAPHAVQPAHVAALVMQGNVVVEGGIHAARAQAVGHGPRQGRKSLPERRAGGKAKQRCGRRSPSAWSAVVALPGPSRALRAPLARLDTTVPAEMIMEIMPAQDRPAPKAQVHAGPGRTQQGIRQAQADKS